MRSSGVASGLSLSWSVVVGRDVGGHPHRNSLAAIHQQVGEAAGENAGLGEITRVVVDEVDRVLVDPGQDLHGQGREAAFRVVVHEPIGDEGVAVAVHPDGVHRLHTRRLDRVDGGEVIARLDQRSDHCGDLGRADPGEDFFAVALPSLDSIDVVPGQPLALGVLARVPDVGRQVRDVILRHRRARGWDGGQTVEQYDLLGAQKADICREEPDVPPVGHRQTHFTRRAMPYAGHHPELQE